MVNIMDSDLGSQATPNIDRNIVLNNKDSVVTKDRIVKSKKVQLKHNAEISASVLDDGAD